MTLSYSTSKTQQLTINFANRKTKKRVEKANYKAYMHEAEAYQQQIINPREVSTSKKRKYNNFEDQDLEDFGVEDLLTSLAPGAP